MNTFVKQVDEFLPMEIITNPDKNTPPFSLEKLFIRQLYVILTEPVLVVFYDIHAMTAK